MAFRKGLGSTSALTDSGAREIVGSGKPDCQFSKPSVAPNQGAAPIPQNGWEAA
jgi:hypothetical protein